ATVPVLADGWSISRQRGQAMNPFFNPWQLAPRHIAVFRALNLGDFLCAVPALRRLRHAAPDAHITFIGLSAISDCVQRFGHYIDEFVVFPGYQELPESMPDHGVLPEFYRSMQARQFDLAIQMHGSGLHTN